MIIEELWILGCEWLMSEIFQKESEEIFKDIRGECYKPLPSNIGDVSDLIVNDYINIFFIAENINKIKNFPNPNVWESINQKLLPYNFSEKNFSCNNSSIINPALNDSDIVHQFNFFISHTVI